MTEPVLAPAKRQLSRAQMAFVRCWAEGLDLQASAARYLPVEGALDGRRAKAALRRLLDDLRHLARAHGRPDVAALLGRDPQAIADRGPPLPTLDEFRAAQPDDFYSEAELAALYRDAFGAPDARGPERRRQRLRERLVLAVQWLERVGVRNPRRDDALAAWLDGRVAGRLAAAGLHTLGDLADRIAARGARWHRGIPRVGEQAAARLQRWLADHADSLGALAVDPPAPTAGDGIVPLERFVPPMALDGSRGANRAAAERCRLAVATDLEAIRAWLARHAGQPHTARAYRREAERLLLWSVVVRGKALSSLVPADCAAYADFLGTPAVGWTAPRHTPRASPAWRPFEGPLSARSAQTALAIVRALFGWLVQQEYLGGNPWAEAPVRVAAPAPAPPRALSSAQWRALQAWLAAQAPCPAQRRLHFAATVAFRTGLRLSELAAARLDWFEVEPGAGGPAAARLRVPMPAGRSRGIALDAEVMDALRGTLADRGRAPHPLANDGGLPLIGRLSGEAPLSAARIHQLLTTAAGRCADDLVRHQPAAADRIRRATAGWLRLGHAAEAARRGVTAAGLQATLGHRSPATTARYRAAARAVESIRDA